MKQVIQSARTGKLALKEVPAPKVRPGHLLVRTHTSLISAGTERLVVDFAKKNLAAKASARPDLVKKVLDKARRDGIGPTIHAVMARLDEPLPLGYSAAGEVTAVGAGLEGEYLVGQRVAVAGAGLANHAEINLVPRNLAAAVPDGVAFEEACYATLAAIAMHGVRNLGCGLGDVVAVVGAGLVGQIATQLLALSGARPLVLDYANERLSLARRLGAEAAFDLGTTGLEAVVADLTDGRGCDGILIAAATTSSQPFETAAAIARDRARVSMVGMTGTTFPFRAFMEKELNIVVSRSYGPGRYDTDFEARGVKYPEGFVRWTEHNNLTESLRLMSPGAPRRLDVGALTTHWIDFERAEDAYRLILDGDEPHLGVVLAYPEGPVGTAKWTFPAAKGAKEGACVLGVIGAGNFAKSVLIPAMKKLDGVFLDTIVAQRGASAEHSRQAFGFKTAAADEAAVFDNPAINAVVIATRHDSHADLTVRALAAGKAVLVEKPLALDRAQINQVINARNHSAAFFQVGFNRRFAPMTQRVHAQLATIPGPRFALIRVNAGAVEAQSWLHDAGEGGGRILGEACHFVDLARFLIGSDIASVQAEAARASAGTCDDVGINLRFLDGSLATIAYTALGDTAASKELIEVYAGGAVFRIDDFRALTITRDGKSAAKSRGRQDKGFDNAFKAFTTAVTTGGPPPIDEGELIETSIATCAVLESLQSGQRIDLGAATKGNQDGNQGKEAT